MEKITQETKQIIMQKNDAINLKSEIENVFMRIEGGGSYSILSMENRLPRLVELYRLIK